MSIARSRGSVCSMGRDPLNNRWVRVGAQVVALEVVVVLGTLFAARFHPTSRPLDAIAFGLGVLAAGAIGVSWRWPAGGGGVRRGAGPALPLRGHAPGGVGPGPLGGLFQGAPPP